MHPGRHAFGTDVVRTDVRRWPGMRSEYSWIPAGDSPGQTAAYQVGVSFTHHDGAVYEADGRTTQSDIPAGGVFVTGGDPITWMRVGETTEALEIFPDLDLLGTESLEPAQATRDGTVLAISSILRRVHASGSTLSDIAASTLAHRIAEHLREEYGGGPSPTPAGRLDRATVDRIAEYVDAELASELTLDRLAGVAMLSPFHFARSFKATTGLAPHQFVIARRIDRAKALLLKGRHAVPDVAYAVGLSNIGHFRRMFRRHLGVNPGELRQSAS
jgi:AraC family transcriptional regulator